MATAGLQEQMGAMALIDEMRHRQMVVQDHLDLPRRREEVARRILEYYRSRNIAVDDAMVEQGVRAYFDKRLSYEAPPAGKLSDLFVRTYISRASWLKPVLTGIAALALLAGGGYAVQQAQERQVQARLAAQASELEQIGARIRQAEQGFQAMQLPPADTQQVQALVAAADNAVTGGDAAAARSALEQLEATLEFAKTPLSINVVDRPGAQTGVARRYGAGGGTAWYLIAEAVDPTGRVVPVAVTSAESGEKQLVSQFGVRVSQDVFERTRADKAEDGVVNEKTLGTKPANALSVRYTRAYSELPDLILEW